MNVREGLVESQGHRLAYLAVNEHLLKNSSEPAVVFVHGILASVNFWRNCVPHEFTENRAWYSLSLPGHHPSIVPAAFEAGDVDANWFFRIMDGALKNLLGTRKAIVIGHSTGGFCALNLAANGAENVAAFISVAGFHKGNWGGFEGLLVKFAGLGKWTKDLFVANLRLFQKNKTVQRLLTASLAFDSSRYLSNPLGERLLENIFPDISQQDYGQLFPLFHGIGSIEIAGQLQNIRIPGYIFACSGDPVIAQEQSLSLSNSIQGVKTIVFEKTGHMPFVEVRERYFEALEEALADLLKRIQNQ